MDCTQYVGAPGCSPPRPPDGILPFTGLSIAAFIGVAVAMVALGLIIRFWGHEPAPSGPEGGRIHGDRDE